MVSFTCEQCQEVLKKNAVAKHYQGRCRGANAFTCIDCYKTFDRQTIVGHTSCTTEEDKWHGQYAKSRKRHGGAPQAPHAGQRESAQKKQKVAADGNGVGRQQKDKAAPLGAMEVNGSAAQWQGNWKSTVEHILTNQPGHSMAWKPLADKAVDLYLSANKQKGGKGHLEDVEALINECLAAVPEDFVNDKDEFVRLVSA
ncbi:LYAR-type C2HC zinc finger protein [Besnoitia besnoiti]|uniref:LYAR-type C2HC zinc finger protein n=1 Tax=Besnoitia besnoiti TaxID=94643 RepID=A0A2A9MIW5_BESBE|nr:LYAR-type C2HC zinc finger protein [Besnoitia besnoiti]PFH35906.1 LYAR-type C2HC zinc finger protein [Besnoitia besnoiti]